MVRRARKYLARALALILALVMAFALAPAVSRAEETRVFDDADLFSDAEEAELQSLAEDFIANTGYDMVVVTSYDAEYGDSNSIVYADDFYDNGGFGTGENKDGMLYFIDMNNRLPTISTCGIMIDYINDSRLSTMFDDAGSYLSDGDYAASAKAVINDAARFVKKGLPEGSYRYDSVTGERLTKRLLKLEFGEVFLALVLGAFAAWITSKIAKAGYSIKGSRMMYDIASGAELDLRENDDKYIRTSVVTTRNDTGSGSGGSSGGGSGSSVHTSSGGMSHGGGSGSHF